ncbi:Oidioi.mRNA.OKI2018_I69.PAR.g9165.t1.cds [Oikopleura dioica]|uniref:Oidioi.mRNA.OKI2018_I69.PAR.g9165.t1.cds n=1 Tax=Oikopleura dioica TaxID=34765 RepID=A0ABN7RJC0_OIKDI|nr:Oidioi.mRNA.OKI2018_I69.PAR.g9165.t1.cds [Oikopleura dioica]
MVVKLLFSMILFEINPQPSGFYYNKDNGLSRFKRGSLISSLLTKEHDRQAFRKQDEATIDHLLGLFNMVEAKRSPEYLPSSYYFSEEPAQEINEEAEKA